MHIQENTLAKPHLARSNNSRAVQHALSIMAQESTNIPFPEHSIPWSDMVRNRSDASYRSKDIRFEAIAQQKERQYHNSKNPEIFHYNQVQEAVVGELLRIYVQSQGGVFYFASKHDDLCNGVDYVASLDGMHFIGIDLCTSNRDLGDLNENKSQITVTDKIRHFHEKPGIPREFFATIRKNHPTQSIPLVVLRIHKETLDLFIRDFFAICDDLDEDILETDMLEYYKEWVSSKEIVPKRIAYILGLQKSEGTKAEYAHMDNIVIDFGKLFAGVETVRIREISA